MPHFLFPLLLLAHLTAIYASSELTSSGEMDLNSILIQPADANKFLSAKGVAKGLHAGGRRLDIDCGSGTWWEEIWGIYGDDECHDCGTGKYQNENDKANATCSFCAAGKQFETNSTACSDCDAGKFQEESATPSVACKFCQAGKNFTVKQTVCIECEAGKYQHENGGPSVTCKFCQAGKEFTAVNQTCDGCSAGQYQEQSAAASVACKSCGKGLYAKNKTDARACRRCEAGR